MGAGGDARSLMSCGSSIWNDSAEESNMLGDRADSMRKTLSSLITSFVRQRMRAESFSLVVAVCRERHFHSLEPSTNIERGRIHVGSSEGSQAEKWNRALAMEKERE